MAQPCHIFLTGQPSIGKTTLIKAVIDACVGETGSGPEQHIDGDVLTCRENVNLCGFYTEESRGADGRRDGFDLVCILDKKNEDGAGSSSNVIKRTSLSCVQSKATKGKPFVGKYLVDVDNVDRFGVASLQQARSRLRHKSEGEKSRTICILDEVGKMEMLCPTFLPAVHGLLDSISECNNHDTKKNACLLLGTIPTPRYGRVIPAVEEIRSRGDVIVLHVTKANRDELRNKLLTMVNSWVNGGKEGEEEDEDDESKFDYRTDLEGYLYQRPIGSGSVSSMNLTARKDTPKSTKSSSATETTKHATNNDDELRLTPCGPLVHAEINPKVLLLGHTASSQPDNPALAYCERSMWTILSRIHDTSHKPIKDAESATKNQCEHYQLLVDRVLQNGVCIWDVLANVHVKGQQRQGKRKSSPNDVPLLLEKHKSIQTICFIGKKAHTEFQKQYGKDFLGQYQAVILPSSSPANSRMTVEEKVKQWKDAIQK